MRWYKASRKVLRAFGFLYRFFWVCSDLLAFPCRLCWSCIGLFGKGGFIRDTLNPKP